MKWLKQLSLAPNYIRFDRLVYESKSNILIINIQMYILQYISVWSVWSLQHCIHELWFYTHCYCTKTFASVYGGFFFLDIQFDLYSYDIVNSTRQTTYIIYKCLDQITIEMPVVSSWKMIAKRREEIISISSFLFLFFRLFVLLWLTYT